METPVPPHQHGQWVRLGEMLARRRTEIEPRYKNRTLFAEATGLNWRLLHDIERAKRDEFKPETLAALETAYQLAPGAIERALKGGDLEPAGTPDPLERARPHPARADSSGVPIPEELRGPAQERADEIQELLTRAAIRTGNPDPDGDQVFGPGSWEAQSWDLFRRQFPSTLRRLWIIAAASVPDDRAPGRQHGTAAGLTAEAALDRGSSAGGTA